MVVTLADAVIRRTPLGAVGCPGDAALAHAAGIVGGALGWDHVRTVSEIAAVKRFYEWSPETTVAPTESGTR
jgi:hypothetical protein